MADKMSRRVLVTGPTGFIGRHLVGALYQRGDSVRVLSRRTTNLFDPGVEVVLGDITDPAAVQVAVKDVDLVFHLAAQQTHWGVPEAQYESINVSGTAHILQAARINHARVIHCSTVGVAEQVGGRRLDEDAPLQAIDYHPNPYHLTKLAAEKLVQEAMSHQPVTIVRPSVTYGPHDDTGMITQLITRLESGFFVYAGNGHNHLHMVYVDDLITGMLLAADSDAALGQTYILTGTDAIQVKELISLICSLLSVSEPRIHIPVNLLYGAGDVVSSLYRLFGLTSEPVLTTGKVDSIAKDCTFSIEKAQLELGYNPQTDYKTGLTQCVEWYQNRA
jgi:nucleoside-diphosphate-sugar epimerase